MPKILRMWGISTIGILFLHNLFASSAFAADDDFSKLFSQFKTAFGINKDVIKELDWVFIIISLVITGVYAYLFYLIVWTTLKKFVNYFRGKENGIFNKEFWLSSGLSIALIVLLASGYLFDIMSWAANLIDTLLPSDVEQT